MGGKNGFTDKAEEKNVPTFFDEALIIADVNRDGALDLIQWIPYVGPLVLISTGDSFQREECRTPLLHYEFEAMNAGDINGDGFVDLIIPAIRGASELPTPILLGGPDGFELNTGEWWIDEPLFRPKRDRIMDVITLADFDQDGRTDIARQIFDGVKPPASTEVYLNRTTMPEAPLIVELLDANGLRNQHGRVIRAENERGEKAAYVVDGGSSYLTQQDYPVFISLPGEAINLTIGFKDGPVSVTAKKGQHIRVYADGQTDVSVLPKAIAPAIPTPLIPHRPGN